MYQRSFVGISTEKMCEQAENLSNVLLEMLPVARESTQSKSRNLLIHLSCPLLVLTLAFGYKYSKQVKMEE